MTHQDRLNHYEKEKQEWIIKAHDFLNKCDHTNYSAAMANARRYDFLVEKVKKIL